MIIKIEWEKDGDTYSADCEFVLKTKLEDVENISNVSINGEKIKHWRSEELKKDIMDDYNKHYKAGNVTIICSWCNKVIKEGHKLIITHGICSFCKEKELSKLKNKEKK